MGILAYFDKETGLIHALPGADDETFVQANGVWTPDGQHVVFARNHAVKLTSKGDPFKDIILNEKESIEVLGGEDYLEHPQEAEKKFMYSLFRIPFNNGKEGKDSPPVLLRNFTPLDEERGANIPEFVNMDPASTRMIHERFLDDYNYFRSGRIYEQFREYDRAEEEFLKSLKINPKSAFSHYSLGTIYAEREDYEKARQEFETVAKLDPENAIVHKDLGSLYFRMREFKKAEEEFKTAIRLDPMNTAAHNNLGSIYSMRQQYDRAETEFRRALNTDPEKENVKGIRFNLGKIYIDTKDFAKAEQEFTAILSIDPDNIDAHHNLGNIYKILNETEKAKNEFKTIKKLDPKNVSATTELGEIYAGLKDHEFAIREFKSVLELDPKDARACYMLGTLLAEKKQAFREAIPYLKQGLSINPRHFDSFVLLGNCYLNIGNMHDALREFERALNLRPNDSSLKEKIRGLRDRMAKE